MKIAFLGDLHGRVFHALALLTAWQAKAGKMLDLVIQAGDLGGHSLQSMIKDEGAFLCYAAEDSTEFDFVRLLRAEEKLADSLRFIRQQLCGPVYFLRGNHEDASWLHEMTQRGRLSTVAIDPFDLFHYVTDGTILECDGVKLAIFGGVGSVVPGEAAPGKEEGALHDLAAYERLLKMGAGAFDVLVAHDTPYGTGIGYWGQVFGSQQISKLMEVVQPQYLVAGHAHQMRGPNYYGNTAYIGLGIIIKARRADPRRTVQPGSMAVYDTETRTLEFVMDDWLADFHGDIDFVSFVEAFSSDTSAS